MFEKHLKALIMDDYPCHYDNKEDYADILIRSAVFDVFNVSWGDDLDFEFMDVLKEKYTEMLYKIYDKAKCDE